MHDSVLELFAPNTGKRRRTNGTLLPKMDRPYKILGRMVLRVPVSLHRDLHEFARENGITVADAIRSMLETYLMFYCDDD